MEILTIQKEEHFLITFLEMKRLILLKILNGYQRRLASMVYKFFDKKSAGSGVNISLELNEQLAKELHKPIIRKFLKSLFWI